MNTSALVIYRDTWHPAAIIQRGLESFRSLAFRFQFLESDDVPDADYFNKFWILILARANIIGDTKPLLLAANYNYFVYLTT